MDHFLLQDLVTDDYCAVKFLMPFEHFGTPALPKDLEAYKEYRCLSTAFVEARNRRISHVARRTGATCRRTLPPDTSATRRRVPHRHVTTATRRDTDHQA